MKHKFADDVTINLEIDIPVDDVKEIVVTTTNNVIAVVIVYMATDTLRHILKRVVG